MPEPQRKAAFVQPGDGAHLAWLGERLRYLLVGEQTAGRFAVSAQVLGPGERTTMLALGREDVGLFVIRGELAVAAGPRTVTIPAGGFVNLGPGVARRLSNAGDVPVEVLAIEAPAGFDELRLRTGYPLSKADAAAPPPSREDAETLAALAPTFGVAMKPASAASQREPRMRLALAGEGPHIAVVGDLYRLLAVSDDTAGRYALWHATVPPQGGPPWHSHAREDEAFYVLRGEVTFRADGATRTVGPDALVHLPSGTRHRFANESDAPVEMLIVVAPGGLERMFAAVGRPWTETALPGPPSSAEIEQLIEEAPNYGIEVYME